MKQSSEGESRGYWRGVWKHYRKRRSGLVGLGVFALLESGCRECWLHASGELIGIEQADNPETVQGCAELYEGAIARRFSYRGTADDRNVHLMSGRVL